MRWALAVVLLCLFGTSWASEATFHGRYYFGHEVRSFHPCGSKKAYWVSADEEISTLLRDRSERLRERRGKPYQPVYVEVVGKIDVKTKREGFAEDYDGLFHIRKLLRVSDRVPKGCAK